MKIALFKLILIAAVAVGAIAQAQNDSDKKKNNWKKTAAVLASSLVGGVLVYKLAPMEYRYLLCNLRPYIPSRTYDLFSHGAACFMHRNLRHDNVKAIGAGVLIVSFAGYLFAKKSTKPEFKYHQSTSRENILVSISMGIEEYLANQEIFDNDGDGRTSIEQRDF